MRYTLIDEIITHDWEKSQSWFKPDTRELAGAQVIKIDNVDEYFWAHMGNGYDLSTLPNIAPPFHNYFMYVDGSAFQYENGTNRRDEFPKYQYGVWFIAGPVESTVDDDAIKWFSDEGMNRLQLKARGEKWAVTAIVFEKYKTKLPPLVIAMHRYLVMEDGSYSSFPDSWVISEPEAKKNASFYGVTVDTIQDAVIETGRVIMGACLLATSLMHCKNVEMSDAEMTSREKQQAVDFERRHKTPATRWKVLNIEPMRRVLSAVGGIEKNGAEKALHICRGHFKDYRNSGGLFGKHKDIYWWEQHMRGSEQNGIVIKDYNIIQ